jgi:uncharacterized protein
MLSRDPTPVPSAPRSRRRWLPWVAGILLVLLLTLRWIATFWTDYLWYDSVDQTGVWSTLIFTRVWMVLAASVVAFLLIFGNLLLADKLSPRSGLLPGSPDEELLARFQDWVEPRVRLVRVLVAAFFGVMIGLGAAVWWQDWLLFRFGGDFGFTDPIYNNDVGLYVFKLPFYRDLFGWGFQLILVVALVTAAVHYLNGAIQVQARRPGTSGALARVAPGVKVHLSVLFAILALLKAVGYQLDKWDLLYSPRGQVTGASYTDVNAQLPALNLLIAISVVAAVILLVNLWFRGWTLPLVAGGLWLFTSLVIGGLYPTLIQRFQVVPDEVNKEIEFVAHNIEFTTRAYGLDGIEVRQFDAASDLDVADLQENRPTIDNIRLWDPQVLNQTYRQLQEIRTFYRIEDVDVDRYQLNGDLTQVMVSARELDDRNIPGGGWVNEHLVYTHGFGVVVSPANDVSPSGQPDFLVRDIPPVTSVGNLEVSQPRIYFGDQADGTFKIVGTTQQEVDFPIGSSGENIRYSTYDGEGGVQLGSIFRRAAFALRFADVDTLISGRLTNDSKVLMVRNVRERIERIAPFLEIDADPYLVVLDGRLQWVLDLYTITDRFPYSQLADTGRLGQGPGLPDRFNYIRNAVKATVDAFDGTMQLYVVDAEDPLIRAQQRIFPDLFEPMESMPPDLLNHLRYPEDLFRIQSDIYRTYHITDPGQFFSNVDPWQIARDPSTSRRDPLRARFVDSAGDEFRPMLPYYLLMKLPGEADLSFLILQPFTPRDRPNMVAFLVAKSDPDAYGQMIDFNLPADRAIDGPNQVGALLNQDPVISAEFTLLSQGGSDVIQGNMLVVPVEESLLYVQPIYISAQSGTGAAEDTQAIPEFKRVVVSYAGRIEMRETLDAALAAVFGEDVPDGDGGDDGDGGVVVPGSVQELLDEAAAAFADADAALRAGDLAGYADSIAEAQAAIEQARALLATAG